MHAWWTNKKHTFQPFEVMFIKPCSLKNWRQFIMCPSCHRPWMSQHCQSSCGSADYLDNVVTKSIVNNRADALKTAVNLFFYDNKLSNCPLSLVDVSHKLQIHVSVRLLTMKTSQRARENFCSSVKKDFVTYTFCLTNKCTFRAI